MPGVGEGREGEEEEEEGQTVEEVCRDTPMGVEPGATMHRF